MGKGITLVSILGCNKNVEATEKAIHHCLNNFDFDDVKFISCVEVPSLEQYRVKINPLTYKEYNNFCVNSLNYFVDTNFCITIQHDGFIIDPSRWTDIFLNYDYIGSPWVVEPNNLVGNGGFSFRSKKFLIESTKLEYNPNIMFPHMPPGTEHTPEDWFLCSYSYNKMKNAGVSFAPVNIAYEFAVEHPSQIKSWVREDLSTYKSFGFHGHFNVAGMGVVHDKYNISN